MLRAPGSSRRERSFPSQAGAACPGTNAISSRGILLLFRTGQDGPCVCTRNYACPKDSWNGGLFAWIAPREAAIEVVRARPREGPDDRGRCARPGARLDEAPQRVDREGEVGALGPLRTGRSDDQHDLPLHVAAKAAGELAQRGSRHLLVQLGQLAAYRGGPVGRQRGQRGERLREPPRRLERDHGLGRTQHALQITGAPGQEALEPPTVGGQPRGDERGGDRRRPWQHLDVEVALQARTDHAEARVGDDWRARLADQRDPRAALNLLRELHGALGLVALVVGDEARAQDVQALEQQACASGVLAGDEVGLAECLPCALAQVLQIADWRWADGEP